MRSPQNTATALESLHVPVSAAATTGRTHRDPRAPRARRGRDGDRVGSTGDDRQRAQSRLKGLAGRIANPAGSQRTTHHRLHGVAARWCISKLNRRPDRAARYLNERAEIAAPIKLPEARGVKDKPSLPGLSYDIGS